MNQDASIQGFTQIGYIIRSQGMNGELRVSFETESPASVEALTIVYLRNDRGDFYPARISEVHAEEKANTVTFFVQFDHIADRSAAEALKNQGIYLETKNADAFIAESQSEEDSLIDCEVYNEDNDYVGLVTDIMENPAHPILMVATTSGSLLIPYVDHYIKEVRDQIIYCQHLKQLEDL